VDPRAGLEVLDKRKLPAPAGIGVLASQKKTQLYEVSSEKN